MDSKFHFEFFFFFKLVLSAYSSEEKISGSHSILPGITHQRTNRYLLLSDLNPLSVFCCTHVIYRPVCESCGMLKGVISARDKIYGHDICASTQQEIWF